LEEMQSFSDLIQEDIYAFLETRQMIDRRTSAGGTAAGNVRQAIKAAEIRLAQKKNCLPEFNL
jgi:argininosuccinate lyase